MSNKTQAKSVSLFTASVITTISISLVLFLLGLTTLIGFTATGFSTYLKENLGVSVELAENLSDKQIAETQKELESNPYVRSALYISKEDVKKQLVEDLGRDPEDVLGYDPSRGFFDVYIKAEYVHPDSMKLVERSLKGKKLIKSVVYNESDVHNANSNLSTIGSILLILAVILVFISFTLIRSIIQLNIYSKRFIINTMQLVGATNSFIRKPFILSMIGCGVAAAILASIGVTAVVYYVTSAFPLSISIVSGNQLLITYGVILACGILIATVATTTAVNRYLRMKTNKLYRV